MAEQHRKIYDDYYRGGSRRTWSERARDEARPWLRSDERWRQQEDRQDGSDERWFAGPGGHSWRDQGDGSYERSSRDRDGDRTSYYAPERDRGWSARDDRDYGRDYGRDADRGDWHGYEDQGRGRSENWNDGRTPISSDERYRQWRNSFNPEYFEQGGQPYGPGGGLIRGGRTRDGRATQAGYRSSSVNIGEGDGVGYGRGAHYERTSRSGDSGRWARESFAGRGPKGYHRSDERITEDISEQLMDDDDIDASEITVHVVQGEVTLTGTVEDRHQKRRAEDIVECVSGVAEVTNNLRVGRVDSSPDFSTSGQTLSGDHSSASQASGSSKATKPTNSAA